MMDQADKANDIIVKQQDEDGAESVQFFEGVEKLLELWFTSSDGKDNTRDLRKIPR